VAAGGRVTAIVRKSDQVADLIRGRIADGSLRPGMYAPSGAELAKETGFAVLTCRKGLHLLFREGVLTQTSRSTRYRVAGAPPADGLELSQALARRRCAAGLMQAELAGEIGMSVTAVGHAETGRLWQSRRFWQRVDLALGADGALLGRYDAWRAGSPPGSTAGEPVTPVVRATPVHFDADGVIVTLHCAPVRITVRWGDGSVTTVQPGWG
jgi:DNA-binding transcriptional regulator YhcF (GntR family)